MAAYRRGSSWRVLAQSLRPKGANVTGLPAAVASTSARRSSVEANHNGETPRRDNSATMANNGLI